MEFEYFEKCKNCIHREVCWISDHYATNEEVEDCEKFKEAEQVVYCKDCISHRDLDEEEYRILKDNFLYCNRINKYMPEKGFCSLGKSRGD